MELEVLSENLQELIEFGPIYDPESIETLLRLRSQLDAFVTASVGEFDTWGEWAADGARNATSWVARKGRLPRAEAGRMVKRARALPHFPNCAEAWKRGELNGAYLDTLERVRNDRTKDALERDEGTLVGEGCHLGRHEDFVKLMGYWEQLADPDGTEEAAEAKRERRDVWLVPSVDGMYLGGMTMDPITGEIFSNELKRLEEELFVEDCGFRRSLHHPAEQRKLAVSRRCHEESTTIHWGRAVGDLGSPRGRRVPAVDRTVVRALFQCHPRRAAGHWRGAPL
jgi:hypothetical protein